MAPLLMPEWVQVRDTDGGEHLRQPIEGGGVASSKVM